MRCSCFLALLLMGCGSTVSVEEAPTGPAPPATAPPEGPPEVPPEMPPEMPPGPAGLCGVEAKRPVGVVVDDEIAVLRGDGSRTILTGVPAGDPWVRVMARGDRAVVVTSTTSFADPPWSTVEAFSADGASQWSVSGAFRSAPVALHPDGRLLVERQVAPGESAFFILDGEIEVPLPASVTWASTWIDAVLRVRLGEDDGFFDPATGAITVIEPLPGTVNPRPWAEGFVSLTGSMGWSMTLHRPSGETTFALEGLDAVDVILARVRRDHALLKVEVLDGTTQWWRARFVDGEVVELPLAPPQGPPPEAMSYCAPDPWMAADGSAVLLGGEVGLQFSRFSPDDGSWRNLGEPIGEVESVGVWDRDGTFVLQGVVGTFCPGPVGQAELSGASIQAVRGDRVFATEGDEMGVRAGGRCVAYSRAGEVHLVDLETEVDEDLGSVGLSWWE